jgi:DNA-binding transcriptional LysR family regulator
MLPGKNLPDQLAVAYQREGLRRDVVMTVTSFIAAAAVVASTDLVTTIPESLLEAHPKLRPVRGPVPSHSVKISMCWHDRTDQDPAEQCLREVVRKALSAP